MDIDFEIFKKRFLSYTTNFLQGSAEDKRRIQLKADHTLRVYNYASTIALNHIECQETGAAARLSALFHDIGRFEQYRDYKTFADKQSINHGLHGVKVLKKEALLEPLPPPLVTKVYTAVGLHNRSSLPANLPYQHRTICNIVRDSDKLDIFSIMLDNFRDDTPFDSTISLGAKDHPDNFNQKMYDNVLNNGPCLYTDIEWTNDFKLILANWSYDLNFSTSYRIFYDSGYFDQIFSALPDTREFQVLKTKLAAIVRKRCTAA